jgi:hypothetical protein
MLSIDAILYKKDPYRGLGHGNKLGGWAILFGWQQRYITYFQVLKIHSNPMYFKKYGLDGS